MKSLLVFSADIAITFTTFEIYYFNLAVVRETFDGVDNERSADG